MVVFIDIRMSVCFAIGFNVCRLVECRYGKVNENYLLFLNGESEISVNKIRKEFLGIGIGKIFDC